MKGGTRKPSLSTCNKLTYEILRTRTGFGVGALHETRMKAVVVGQYIYLVHQRYQGVSALDTTTEVWSLKLAREVQEWWFEAQMAWLDADRLFVFGPHPTEARGVFRYFDLVTNQWELWEPKGACLGPRLCTSGEVHERSLRFVVFGGSIANVRDNALIVVHHDREMVYRPEAKGVPPSKRSRHGTCITGDVMFVYGGRDEQDQMLNDVHCLCIAGSSFTWSQVVLATPVQEFHAMVYVPGRIFIYGGSMPNNEYSDKLLVVELEKGVVSDVDSNNGQIEWFHQNQDAEQIERPAAYRPDMVLLSGNLYVFYSKVGQFMRIAALAE